MQKQLSWKEAILTVLRESGVAMHGNEITRAILDRGLRTSVGATPVATVGSQIYTSLKSESDRSPFVRVGKATFGLRSWADHATPGPAGSTSSANPTRDPAQAGDAIAAATGDEDAEAGLVGAFGMYWERASVHWAHTPKLLGQQDLKALAVDFAPQAGVYLLHDGRHVVYVGRASVRQNGHALGRRLFEHTYDRLKGRWDRFSWFGLLPVREDGSLASLPESFPASETLLVATLEALLIEALEPPQNRKRGDDFRAVEFIQVEDPEHEKRRREAILQDLIKRI